MQPARDGQIRVQSYRQLGEDAVAADWSGRDKQSCLCFVVHLQEISQAKVWGIKRTRCAVSTSSPICRAVVHIVPCPPAIVAYPSPTLRQQRLSRTSRTDRYRLARQSALLQTSRVITHTSDAPPQLLPDRTTSTSIHQPRSSDWPPRQAPTDCAPHTLPS